MDEMEQHGAGQGCGETSRSDAIDAGQLAARLELAPELRDTTATKAWSHPQVSMQSVRPDASGYVPPQGPEPRSLGIRLSDVEIHALEWGAPERQPVLMIHGMRGHARWFSPVGPVVGRTHRALSMDLRGHGESGHAPPYGHVQYAADVVELVRTLDLERVIVVGHSMGGGVALRAVAELGERVAGLVLVDAGIGMAGSRWQRVLWRLRFGLRGPPRGLRGPRGFRAPRPLPVYASWNEIRERFKLRPGDTIAEQTLLDHLAGHAIRELPEGGFTWRFAPDMTPGRPGRATDVASIHCPTVLIYGAESPIRLRADPRRARKMFTGASRVDLEIIPDAHHHVFLDCPDAFNATLVRYLRQLS